MEDRSWRQLDEGPEMERQQGMEWKNIRFFLRAIFVTLARRTVKLRRKGSRTAPATFSRG
jgi:hypothetical protein